MIRTTLATLLASLGLVGSVAAQLGSDTTSVSLDDIAVIVQSNREQENTGCNATFVYSIREPVAIFHLPDSDLNTIMTGLTSTTDFTQVFVLSGSHSGRITANYQPHLDRLQGGQPRWEEWTPSSSVTGARLTADRSVAIMPDDETLLVEEYGPPGADDRDAGIAKYCLSEIAPDGRLGPRRGFFRTVVAENRPDALLDDIPHGPPRRMLSINQVSLG